MDANCLILNPRAGSNTHPVCPDCEEKIIEKSYENENRFVCGCEELKEFVIPVDDKTDSEDEQ